MKPGDVIHDRFVIERFVARGGMGEVFRALDRQTQQPVAMKLLAGEDEVLVERFGAEARALSELDHPAIVRYVAHGFAPGAGLYLAMEWLEGSTLSRRLRHEPLTVDESLRLAARVADGLGVAHKLGMVHRDVKPGNLFLLGRRADSVKILDFGLVRTARQQITATGVGMGTPDYMAPEQARCERNVGPAADIFALGCVLYRCLTGQAAFQGEHVKAILAKIAMLERPPRVTDLTPELPGIVDELVASMMAHDPALRPADGAAASEAIRAVRARLERAERAGIAPESASLTTSEQLPMAVLFVDLERTRRPRMTPVDVQAEAMANTVRIGAGAEPSPQRVATAAEALDPEEDPAIALARQAVEPLGGKVVPLINGSLVVTLSGGAAAHELAARAARGALAIRAVLPRAAIALATRHVVVDDYRAASPVIDGAAAMARSRRIRIDKRTRELLPEHFEVEGDETEGYALVSERAVDTVPRRLLGRATPHVGRQAVLRQLQATLEGTIEEGGAHALVVVGEAGVGKSRLRGELVTSVREAHKNVAVVQAFGDALRSGVPAGLLARALRGYLGLPDGSLGAQQVALRARIEALVPEADRERLVEFLGQVVGVPLPASESAALRAAHQDPQLMADQKRRAFEDWLVAECKAQPVLFVVDDLHWADPVSVELLGAGLRRARDLPLVVLALGRPELQQTFPKLDEQWGRQEIRLDPLRPQACEQLARAALGDEVDGGLVRQLVERSGGNPFYLEELIRAAASPEPLSLPPSVVASTQLRIGRRPPRARQVLRAASIFGRVFWAGGVSALLRGEMEGPELDEWLGLLERDELIERRAGSSSLAGETEYAFRHDLLRDAAYQMLTPEDRMIGHRLAGAWLVEHGEGDAVVLAEHFAGGGVTSEAVSWFERAAKKALAAGDADVEALRKAASHYLRAGQTCAAAYANSEAVAYFERAAALWAPLDPLAAARARVELAQVRERAGERERALADLKVAEEAADAGGAKADLRVEILLQRAQLETRGGGEGAMERARKTAEAALALAKGTRALEARALMSMAMVLTNLETADSSRRAAELAQRALTLSEERGPLAWGLWRLGNAFLIGNDLDRADKIYADALLSAQANRDDLLLANVLGNQGMVAFRRYAVDDAIAHTRRALAEYERIGHRTRILEMNLNLGFFLHVRGETAVGRDLLERVIEAAQGDWILTTVSQETLANADRLEGREMRAQGVLLSAARTCEKVGVPKRQALFLGLLAESLWASGEGGAAVEALEKAARVSKALTLSHAFLLLHLGPLDDAIEWLARFADAEPDPPRRFAARLGQARGLLWTGERSRAMSLCTQELLMMQPVAIPRHHLPIRCLQQTLCGDLSGAIETLELAQTVCAPHERAEAALDVGTALVETANAPSGLIERWLELSSAAPHRGIRHRIEDLRADLYERLSRPDKARESLKRSQHELERLREKLPEEYQERLDEHPWTQSIRRMRAVP